MDAPYRNVYHALAAAYALENVSILRISSALRDLRSEGLSRGVGYFDSPWDRHAQAALVFVQIYRHCHQPEIIECKYRKVRSTDELHQKIAACIAIAQRSQFGYDAFTVLATAHWAGLKLPRGWIAECVTIINKSKRSLWYLRNRIFAELDGKLDSAIERLDEPMLAAGIIDHYT